jgi:hypothetical protein
MKKINSFVLIVVFFISCNTEKNYCVYENFNKLNLAVVNTFIEIPPHQITDTLRYGKETDLYYTVKSIDSSITLNAFVTSTDSNNLGRFDITHVTLTQKQEVENGQNSKKLLSEKYKTVDNVKVGYLKYLIEQSGNTFFEGRIYFYKDKKLVVLWIFEKYEQDTDKNHLTMDCMLESLEFNK